MSFLKNKLLFPLYHFLKKASRLYNCIYIIFHIYYLRTPKTTSVHWYFEFSYLKITDYLVPWILSFCENSLLKVILNVIQDWRIYYFTALLIFCKKLLYYLSFFYFRKFKMKTNAITLGSVILIIIIKTIDGLPQCQFKSKC